MQKKRKLVNYAKWGYIFILPFFASFFIFSLIPLIDTIRYSFYEYYRSGIKEIGPNFIGMTNYVSLLQSDMLKYAGNTLILNTLEEKEVTEALGHHYGRWIVTVKATENAAGLERQVCSRCKAENTRMIPAKNSGEIASSYQLVWEDNFEGENLNTDDWN